MNKKIGIVVVFFSLLMGFSCKKEETQKISFSTIKVDKNKQKRVAVSRAGVQPQQEKNIISVAANENYPIMTFETKEHDFGTIQQGEMVSYTFKFTNTGKSDLVITDAKASCGCTIPEYPKEPIQPGKSSKLYVSFNSAGKRGLQLKTITITANTANGKETLLIKTSINSKPGEFSGITSH